MNPLVTLIVAVYNTASYLEQCLDSVRSQTYTNWELIIVDDGSKDDTPAICDRYAKLDKRILVIHKKNTGKADSTNLAIGKARGEYIGFIDSDDWIDPNFCEILLRAIKEGGKDCATCSYLNEFVNKTIFDPQCSEQEVLDCKETIVRIYNRQLYGYLHGRLYHRRLLIEPIPKLIRYEDFAVVYKWLSHGNGMILCPDYLYHYRQRKSSIMNRRDDHMYGFVELLEELYHFVKRKNLLPERQNKEIVVENCMRIAKDIARQEHSKKTNVYLCHIRDTLIRLHSFNSMQFGFKLRFRMWLLFQNVNLFKIAMSFSQIFIFHREEENRQLFL